MTGQPFANEVVGGGGALIVPVIRSPDFSVAAQTGWAIYADGTAYFFNVTATGAVTAQSVVIDGPTGGLFIYSGTPAAGNLVLTATSQSGQDHFGNAYSGPGICANAPGTSNREIQIRPDLNAVLIYEK